MPTIREYLVSLGAEVDNKSFNKFNRALNSAGKNVAIFGAGLAALMTMVAKTSISLDKTTQSYEKMAEKQKKSLELIRAQETALKILGKTEKEVKADKALKEQYDTLKKISEEIKLPSASDGERSLRGLLQDFDKFRMVSTYAMNWINHVFLSKIQAPLEQVRKQLQGFTERLKYNMPRIADTVGTVFSNLFRLAMAGVTAIGNVIDKFDKLPGPVKAAGAAIATAFGLSKLNPAVLGLGLVLLLLEDYQTYLRGGEAALGDFYEAMENGTAFEYFKEKLSELPEKIAEIENDITNFLDRAFTVGDQVAKNILEGLSLHDFSEDGVFISNFFGALVTDFIDFLNTNIQNGSEFAVSWAEVGGVFVAGLADTIGIAIGKFPWMETFEGLMAGANNLLSIIGDILFGEEGAAEDPEKYQGLVAHFHDAAKNIIGGIGSAFLGISPSDVAGQVSTLFSNMFGLIGRAFSKENNANADDLLTTLTVTASEIATKIFQIIGQSFGQIDWGTAGSTIGNAMNSIMERIVQWLGVASMNLPFVMHQAKDSMKKVASGILTFLGSAFKSVDANSVKGVISGIFGVITGFIDEALKQDSETEGIFKTAFSLALDIAEGIVGIIGTAFDPENGLSMENVKNALVSICNGVFGLIKDALSTENISRMAQMGLDLIDIGKNLIITTLTSLSGAFSEIGITEIGQTLGDGFVTFYTKVSEWLGEQIKINEDGGSILGTAGESIVKIASALVKGIGTAIGTLAGSGVAQEVGSKFAKFIGSAISDLAKKLTGEDSEIDFTQLGTDIGQAISDAITIGVGWLTSFVESAMDWLISGGGLEALADIGAALAAGIMNGLGSLGQGLLNLLGIDYEYTPITREDLARQKRAYKSKNELSDYIEGLNKAGDTDTIQKLLENGFNLYDENGNAVNLSYGDALGFVTGMLDSKYPGGLFMKNPLGDNASPSAPPVADVSEAMNEAASAMEEAAEALASVVEDVEEEASFFEAKEGISFDDLKSAVNKYYGFTTTDGNGKPVGANQYGTYTAMSRLGSKGASELVYNGKVSELTRLSMSLGSASNIEEYIQAAAALDAYLAQINAERPNVKVNVDTSEAMRNVEDLITKINSVPGVTGSAGGQNALGGRYSTATRGVFGEDGTEYIIPITKPARAKALIMQMFQEMGAGASSILSELGVSGSTGMGGPGSSWSSQPAAMYPSAGGSVKSNSDNNVNVPTTINVYGSGDALTAGQAAARASQSNVLRAVRGVVGA